ncbi:MAG TPA: hypothetical protein VHB79_29215 [Polyangiaceae bacterium]|nr:hypothetical protein [Polyangiaceae bacterium]
MAKSSKPTRGSAAKAGSKKRPAAPAKKPAPARTKAVARSAAAPTKKAPVKTAAAPAKKAAARAVTAVTSSTASSPLVRALTVDEQRAVRLALSGKATLLSSAPRSRDALLFAAAASIAPAPVVVASPHAAELLAQVVQFSSVEVVGLGAFASSVEATSKRRLARGGSLLVVVDPARLFDAELRQAFAKAPPALLGIAAAHACSEHAHELCAAYLSLREALPAFGAAVLATSTSTSPRVIDQVAEALGAKPANIIERSQSELARAAQVVRAGERKTALFAVILERGAPGVVLTATPQEADSVYAELCSRKVACVRAHAGMSAEERNGALTRFADPRERLVLVTQSPHANASGLAGCPEASQVLGSAPPRRDLSFVVHYQAPLSPEQHFEDVSWLPDGGYSLVLADSSDAALVQALLAQQRVKPAAVEAVAQALAQAPTDRPIFSDTLALRAGTSRRSAERVLSAFADRSLITRDSGQIARRVSPEQLAAEGRLLAARFAALRAGDVGRAEQIAAYVTSRHSAVATANTSAALHQVRA